MLALRVVWLGLLLVSASQATTWQSQFAQSDEGWTTIDAKANSGGVTMSDGGITYTDTGATEWWFSAPSTFTGDKTSAYNGKLTFTLGPVAFNDNGATAQTGDDVVLVAQCGHLLIKRGVVTAGSLGTYEVLLNEDGWIDSRTDSAPNVFDFLGVLNNLQGIWIRGNYYAGGETTRLDAVTLTTGTTWHPCCTMSNDVDLCSAPGSPYYNPATLKFYCEGSKKKLITVTKVEPRFARRTGGTTITVTGTNLGLAGSQPIVRVNNQDCQKSYYLYPAGSTDPSQAATSMGPVQQTSVVCVTPPGEGLDLSVTVEAAPGPTDTIRKGRSDKGWEYYETTSTSCISANNRGFQYGGHDFEWVAQLRHASYALTGDALTDASVAVDRNTGDVYITGTIVTGTTYTLDPRAAPTQTETSITCSSDIGSCAYVAKLSKEGVVAWATTIETDTNPGGSSLVRGLDIAVDSTGQSSNKPRIYVVGTAAGAGTGGWTVKAKDTTGAWNGQAANIASTTTGMWIVQYDSDGVYGGWIHNVYRCLPAGGAAAVEYPCAQANQDSSEVFNDDVRLAIYRPSVSDWINQHTKGDAPSNRYILGSPRDNGGVYVTGTIQATAAASVVDKYTFFGSSTNPNYAPTATATEESYPRLGKIGHVDDNTLVTKVGYLVKYDDLGNPQWLRAFGTDIAETGTNPGLVSPTVTGIAADNDAIFVTGFVEVKDESTYATVNMRFESCVWQTIEVDTSSTYVRAAENIICGNEVGQAKDYGNSFDTTESVASTTMKASLTASAYHSFVVAYSAAGEVKWLKDTTKDDAPTPNTVQEGDDFRARAITFVRPLVGNAPLMDHISGPPAAWLEGRGQPTITSFADGFYVFVAGDFLHAASRGEKVLGKQLKFPSGQAASAYMVFLFKLHASDGSAEWVSWWGDCLYYGSGTCAKANPYTVKSIAADPRTGALFLAGVGQSGATSPNGFDAFYMATQGLEFMPSCSVDPNSGLTDAQQGRSRCLFYSATASGNTGFLIKVDNPVYDSTWNIVASKPDDKESPAGTTYTERPSVQWVKSFGVTTTGTTGIEDVCVVDNSVYAIGHYLAQNAGTLAFEGISTTFSAGASQAARLLVKLTE